MEMIKYSKGKTEFPTILFICGFAILLVIIWIFKPRIGGPYEQTPIVVCTSNMKQLGIALMMYAQDNSNNYPTPENWCDLISPYLGRDAKDLLRCPEAEIKDAKCHYAINPDCKHPPKSSLDTVLLFETQGGWNLFGGPELLTTENHSNKTCNVLLNDGSVVRIKENEIAKLKWNIEGKK